MALSFGDYCTVYLIRVIERRIARRRDPSGTWILEQWGDR